MRSLEQVNIRTNVRTYVLTYIRTGQTLYPLHNFVVRGDNKGARLMTKFLKNSHWDLDLDPIKLKCELV